MIDPVNNEKIVIDKTTKSVPTTGYLMLVLSKKQL